jgi:hypothetical protein
MREVSAKEMLSPNKWINEKSYYAYSNYNTKKREVILTVLSLIIDLNIEYIETPSSPNFLTS